jgi:glycosyltransferase involved in cell wall biosynthesis
MVAYPIVPPQCSTAQINPRRAREKSGFAAVLFAATVTEVMLTDRPLVSVIVLATSGGALEKTIRSVEVQSFPSLEILVCGPEESLTGLQGGVPPRTITLLPGTSKDIAAAWMAGSNWASGEYVCLLAEGDELAPTYLEKCLFQLTVSGGDAAAAREEPQDSGPYIRVLKKHVLLAVGGYDVRWPASEQRVLIASRLASHGFNTVIVPEVLARPADRPIGNFEAGYPPVPGFNGGRCYSYAHLVTGWPLPRPTVLVAMPFLTVGGSESVVSSVCRQLKGLGFRILLYTTIPTRKEQGDTTSWFENSVDGIYHLPRFLNIAHWPAFLAYLIQQHGVSILWQVGSTYTYDLLPDLKRLFPQLAAVDLLFNTIGHTANHLNYNYLIDHVITEHTGMKEWLIERGVQEDRISVIPNGVDLEVFSPRPKRDWRTRALRSRGDGHFVAGFLGRLSEEKAPDVFLEIAARLADHPFIEFLVCGSGAMEPVLRKDAEERGLAGVHFLGVVSTCDFLPCCDVVVVCSRLDGRPNIVMESMAMGIPVVASAVGGIPEMMPPGEKDLLCEPAKPDAFAAAILLLERDPVRYQRAAQAARTHAEGNFPMLEGGRAYARIFDDLRRRRQVLDRHSTPEMIASSLGYDWNSRQAHLPALNLWRACSPLAWPRHFRNALLLRKLRRNGQEQKLLAHFDAEYYSRQFPQTKNWKMSPLLHYLFLGFRQGRNPSSTFDTRYYLASNSDVRRSGVNPLLHFVIWGEKEGRWPMQDAPD